MMMKLQETFKYLYCKIPLVDPPPITRVLLFAEFIWVGEKTQKVISFGDVCKYDWCLHKLFKTPLLRNVKKVEVSKFLTITISMVLLRQNRQLPFLNCVHDDSQQFVEILPWQYWPCHLPEIISCTRTPQ